MSIVVRLDELAECEEDVIKSLRDAVSPDKIEIDRDIALIAIVGRGMKSQRGTAARIFAALAHAKINVKMIDQGSSELNVIVGIGNEYFEAAIKAITLFLFRKALILCASLPKATNTLKRL